MPSASPPAVLNARDLLEVLLGDVENEEALLRDYVDGHRIPLGE